MEIITLLQIFCSFWYATFLILTKQQLDYKVFVFGVAVISVLYYLREKFIYHYLERKTVSAIAACLFILLMFCVTPYLYGYQNQQHRSYLLVYIAQIVPIVIIASNNANKRGFVEKIDRMSPVLAIIFTTIAIYAITHQRVYTGGGGMSTEYCLDYQNTSYIAAYASNYCLYEILFGCNNRKHRIPKFAWIILFIIDFALMIGAGGRGGLMTFVSVNLFVYWLFIKNNSGSQKPLIFGIAASLFILIVLPSLLSNLQQNALTARGFDKIASFLVDKNTSGRTSIYQESLQYFLDSPIWGHGIGSVFYIFGYYSHNLFTDCLVETGLIGTVPVVILIITTLKKGMMLITRNISCIMLMILFLQGFVIAMFSGYYLAQFQLIGLIVIILMIDFPIDCEEY